MTEGKGVTSDNVSPILPFIHWFKNLSFLFLSVLLLNSTNLLERKMLNLGTNRNCGLLQEFLSYVQSDGLTLEAF